MRRSTRLCWPATFVTDASLVRVASEIRSALDDDARLLYVRSGVLMAVPLDLGWHVVTGTAVTVIQGVAQDAGGEFAEYAVSRLGDLVYVPGGLSERTLVWVDRVGGRVQPVAAPPHFLARPRFS